VDAHSSPAKRSEPAHHHLDLRFLLICANPQALAHDPTESHGARWLGWDEALQVSGDPALRRLFEKARRNCHQTVEKAEERLPSPEGY